MGRRQSQPILEAVARTLDACVETRTDLACAERPRVTDGVAARRDLTGRERAAGRFHPVEVLADGGALCAVNVGLAKGFERAVAKGEGRVGVHGARHVDVAGGGELAHVRARAGGRTAACAPLADGESRR
eukprot:3183231-Pleurochrysis_carterae.AAC.4